MEFMFYLLSFFSVFSTLIAILHSNPIYTLLYLIISFISISGIFFILGAFFAATLQIILYTGAIMVLFVFVVMILNLGNLTIISERKWFYFLSYVKTFFLSFVFFIIMSISVASTKNKNVILNLIIDFKDIGFDLFSHHSIIVESISMILLTALIIIFHIGKNAE
ncbi:NADH-quinone oxidoreductase subunit J [Buchnera aphidicola (Mollitrichosiphum nigrofasciatum)]|uniref:NADH-quinone oxidoreductase subunit J family protein n=1 Tax=Buchnera aphidicola TaxID=9 RepID=UPI0031B865FA